VHPFDGATAVRRLVDDRYEADLAASWSSLSGIHGGYLAAVAARAMTEAVADRQLALRTLTATFLRRTDVGSATVAVEVLRDGRALTTLRAAVEQGEATTAVFHGTFAAALDGPAFQRPSLARPDPAHRRRFEAPERVRHFDNLVIDLDRRWYPFDGGPVARLAGWLTPRTPRPIDSPWLVMAADVLPPATFVTSTQPAGGMTLDYAITILADPADVTDQTLVIACESELAAAGMAVERCVLWSGEDVVATATQTRFTARTSRALQADALVPAGNGHAAR
jgi:acyl-coenzyme A thioesterase PaaI-like protein